MTFVALSLPKYSLFSDVIPALLTKRILRSLSCSFKNVRRSSVILLTNLLSALSNLGDSLISTVMEGPFRIFDPVMKYANKNGDKTFLNSMEVLEGELTLIKLSIKEYFLDNILDVRLNPFWCWVVKNT